MKHMHWIGAALTATLMAACNSVETPTAQPSVQAGSFKTSPALEASSKSTGTAAAAVSAQAVKFVGALPMQSIAPQALLPLGTKLTPDGVDFDDDEAGFPIYEFNYFGTRRYGMTISINGFVSFDYVDTGNRSPYQIAELNYAPGALPSFGDQDPLPGTMIAPYWADLQVCGNTPNQGVYLNYLTNPNRTVVTWRAQRYVEPCDGDTTRTATIQLVLDSGVATQSPITFNYQNASAVGFGGPATIGFKNNAQFSQWSYANPLAIGSSYSLRSFPTQAATPGGFPSF